MTTQWGAPLTGAQMKLLRAAGLPDGTEFEVFVDRWGFCSAGKTPVGDIHDYAPCRLPADHIAYTLLVAGWLDGRNVALWFGGEKAPEDWDGGPVLLADGTEWSHAVSWYMPRNSNRCIIAYIRKAEIEYPPANEKLKEAVRLSREMTARTSPDTHSDRTIGRGLPDFERPETVTIAKMIEAEARKRFAAMTPERVVSELGLLKEPTRLERFWSSQPNGGAHVTNDVKAWVLAALYFEND